MRLLIEAGQEVDARDENDDGDSALMKAAYAGHLDVVRFLVGQGANIHLLNSLDQNALMFAVAGGQLDVVIFLFDNGASLGFPWNKGEHEPPPGTGTPCHFISREGILVYCSSFPDASLWNLLGEVPSVFRADINMIGMSPNSNFGWVGWGGHLDILHTLLGVGRLPTTLR